MPSSNNDVSFSQMRLDHELEQDRAKNNKMMMGESHYNKFWLTLKQKSVNFQ